VPARAVQPHEQVLRADAERPADLVRGPLVEDAQAQDVAKPHRQGVDARERASEPLALLGDLVRAGLGRRDRCGAVILVVRIEALVPALAAQDESTASNTSCTASSASAASRRRRWAKRTR